MRDLEEFVEIVSLGIDMVWPQTREISAMFHVITADGDHVVLRAPNGLGGVEALRKAFFAIDVVAYCYVDEGYSLTVDPTAPGAAELFGSPEARIKHIDSIEELLFAAENTREKVFAHRRINRPANGPPTLGPLKFHATERMEGGLPDLLPKTYQPEPSGTLH